MTTRHEQIVEILARPERRHLDRILGRLEALLVVLVERQQVREWYTTHEFAQIVGKAEFTIRNYCRGNRLNSEKRRSGRGKFQAWVISHAELLRYQREGLLPCRRLE